MVAEIFARIPYARLHPLTEEWQVLPGWLVVCPSAVTGPVDRGDGGGRHVCLRRVPGGA